MPDIWSDEVELAVRGTGESWADWPEELYVHQAADVQWIKDSSDPLVWHDAALACLIYQGDQHGLLHWLAKQPCLDRVTATAMFLHNGNGERYVTGQALNCHLLSEELTAGILKTLCRLDVVSLLDDNGIGLPPDWEAERQATLARLPWNPDLPLRFLQGPVDRQTAKMPYYDIGEGDLMSYRFMQNLHSAL